MSDKKRTIGFRYAWNGLVEVFKSECNFRYHIISAVVVIMLGIVLQISMLEWALITFCIALVLITEMLNSVIEKMMDYMKPEIHPTAKIIKDISAGSVLLAAITASIIGLLIFVPKLLMYLSNV